MRFVYFLSLLALVGCGLGTDSSDNGVTETKTSVLFGQSGQPQIRVEQGEQPDEIAVERQGYETAKQRLIQMEVLRRAARGSLSFIFGEKAYNKDRMLHGLGVVEAVNRSHELAKGTPEYNLLEAYARGVNKFITNLETEDYELLLRYRRITGEHNGYPQPWHPIDSIAIGEGVAFLLSSQLNEKVVYSLMNIALLLDAETVLDLIDTRPVERISIVNGLKREGWTDPQVDFSWFGLGEEIPDHSKEGAEEKDRDNLFSFPFRESGVAGQVGSNNWVVNAKFAGGNKVIVSNDPHLPLTFPTLFHEASIDSTPAGGTFKVAGVNVPGIPGVMIGHNEEIAWGFTNSSRDIDDIYFEYLEEGGVKKAGGVIEPLRDVVYRLGIRQRDGSVKQEPITVQFVKDHGPIFSPHIKIYDPRKKDDVFVQDILEEFLDEGYALAYKWMGHQGSTEVKALIGLNRAKNFNEFKQALSHFKVGAQNVVYGDRQGNIGYYSHGDFPVKSYMSRKNPPFMLVRGDKGYNWDGVQTEIPELYNPDSGFIVTANNGHYGYNQTQRFEDPATYTSFRYAPGLRARRIHDLLLENKGKIDAAKMNEIQTDNIDLLADRVLQLVEKVPADGLSKEATALRTRLLAWNRGSGVDSKEALLFQVLMSRMTHQYARDIYHFHKDKIDWKDLLDASLEQMMLNSVGIAVSTVYHRLRMAISQDAAAAKRFVDKSFEEAIKTIAEHKLDGRRWGDVHVLEWSNLLDGVMDPRPFIMERAGTFTTVDMAGYKADSLIKSEKKNFHLPSFIGPSFRMTMVLEPGKPIQGFSIMPGGNLGDYDDPASYKELLQWGRGETRPLIGFQ